MRGVGVRVDVRARRRRRHITIDGRVVLDQKDLPTSPKDAAPDDGVRVYFGSQTAASVGASSLDEGRARFDDIEVY